jgi:cobalamin biosynthesis protein CobD/CbiB
MEAQDDPLRTGLASGYVASRIERPSQQRVRRPRSRLRVYGCLLLLLVVLVGPLIGLALTKGLPHQIFTYVLVGMVVVFLIPILIAMLATRRGREALSEGCMEGCLDAILGGFLGGG